MIQIQQRIKQMEYQSFSNLARQHVLKRKQSFRLPYSQIDLNRIIKQSTLKSPKPDKKPNFPRTENISLIAQYKKLLKSTHAHAQHSKKQMQEQMRKHNKYFENLYIILKKKQVQSEAFLQKSLEQIQNVFDKRIQFLNYKIVNLCCPSSPNPIFRQFKELENLNSIKVEVIKLQIPNIKTLEQQIQKITFGYSDDMSLIDVVNHSTKGEQQIIQNLYQLTCKQSYDSAQCCMKLIQNKKFFCKDKIILEASEFSQEGSLFYN